MDPALAKEVEMLAQARAINDAIKRGDSEIQRFYKDTTMLITGATGFMGKQMLEKLFRSCDIKKVFLLTRPKKNKSFEERLGTILEDPVFDSVKKMKPGFEKKIFPIHGNLMKLGLGICDEERNLIIEETEIIIHGAATVNFDEPLKVAVNTNVRGTVEMLKLGKQCKKLKSYVHISTAFSHATYSRVDKEVFEKFYDAPLSPEVAIEMANTMNEKTLNDITPQLIQDWPNTYTFTKAIAEEAVRQVQSELPICIVRPAVVIASLQEPLPGWMDISCAYGPTGLVLGTGLGVLHTFLMSDDVKINLVPVDLVNNAIIVAGWAVTKVRERESTAKIYSVSNIRNDIKFGKMINYLINVVNAKYATPKALYYVFLMKANNRLKYWFLAWLWHYIPAYIGDLVLRIMGRKPIAVSIYSKADKQIQVLSNFTMYNWFLRDDNLQEMVAGLSPTDRLIYECDPSAIKWDELLVMWALGTRNYIVKDGLQGTEYAVKKQFWLRILHFTVVLPLYFFLLYKVAMLAFSVLYSVSDIVSIFN